MQEEELKDKERKEIWEVVDHVILVGFKSTVQRNSEDEGMKFEGQFGKRVSL